MITDRSAVARTRRPHWRAWLVLNCGYGLVLLALSLAPSVPVVGVSVSDRLAHGVAYGLQTGLLYVLFDAVGGCRWPVLWACLGAVGFGGLTEALQLLQPARSPEPGDLVANFTGVVLVGLLIGLLRSRQHAGGEGT